MNKGISIWLDALRAVATLVVVLSHWAYPRFTEGRYIFFREWNIGSDAVILFFVISGCVIAYAAGRDKYLGLFTFNRLTRLWSVLIPALVLTWVFDIWGNRMDPAAYPCCFYMSVPIAEFFGRGLTFSNQWSMFEWIRLGTNGPLWSLSFEAAYYALFAVAVFTSGILRLVLIVSGILVFGMNVILLMPAWLMGVYLWKWLQKGNALSRRTAIYLAVGAPVLYILCHVLQVPETLLSWTKEVMGVDDPRRVISFSDEFIWNALIGVLTIAHLMGMAVLVKSGFRGETLIRWFAGASFSIYVTHYPALHLLDAMIGDVAARDLLLLAGSIFIGLVFAAIFERPIGWFRSVLRSLFSARYLRSN